MGGFNHDNHDPFAIFTAPPPGETPAEKAIREKREADAQRISDKIDEDLKNERAALKKQKNIVRVLLLGQSESGKSTTLKNFRMKYARTAWKQERASWRAVIQLNLIRSIITIVETLQAEMNGDPILDAATVAAAAAADERGDELITTISAADPLPVTLTDKHQLLKLRLGPLRRVEADLKRRLGAGSEEIQANPEDELHATPFDADGSPGSKTRRTQEFVVRCWKDALERPESPKNAGGQNGEGAEPDDATDVIASCKDDMKAIWKDGDVRAVLKKRKLRLEDSAGFFLDDLERIATRSYEPSDDDVVRARLRTLGVQEHKILFEQDPRLGHEFGREWIIYDVGGSRTSRHAWLPYFENVNAIIFLAPVSCFDERLTEDPRINRLEDSFILWRSIVSSTLLTRATMIVFLNKCDLLKRKLKTGVQVRKHLPSYGERPNDGPTVVKYLREKFKDTLKQHSPEPRVGYFYPTSVTDTKATATTLKTVRDGILREHLKNADFV